MSIQIAYENQDTILMGLRAMIRIGIGNLPNEEIHGGDA